VSHGTAAKHCHIWGRQCRRNAWTFVGEPRACGRLRRAEPPEPTTRENDRDDAGDGACGEQCRGGVNGRGGGVVCAVECGSDRSSQRRESRGKNRDRLHQRSRTI
jgi:hypothetical protein